MCCSRCTVPAGASPARDAALKTCAGARSTRRSRPGVAPTAEARYGALQERAPLAMPPSKHAPVHDQRADRDRGSLLQRRPGMALCRSEPRSRFRFQNMRRRTINAPIATGGRSYSGGTVWLSAGASPARDSAFQTRAGARSTRRSRLGGAPAAEARHGFLQERAPLAIPPSRHAPVHDQRADRDRGALLQRRHGMAFCMSEPRSPLVEPVGHAGPTMEWLLRKP